MERGNQLEVANGAASFPGAGVRVGQRTVTPRGGVSYIMEMGLDDTNKEGQYEQ
jgi:hypothetical protein